MFVNKLIILSMIFHFTACTTPNSFVYIFYLSIDVFRNYQIYKFVNLHIGSSTKL